MWWHWLPDLVLFIFLISVGTYAWRQRAQALLHAGMEEKSHLLHDLTERVKELTALHAAMQFLQQAHGPTATLFPKIVALLPPAWQYPEITAARLTFAGETAQTENFSMTRWCQRAEFSVASGDQGTLEVVYLEERPPAAEGPFLAEERNLINSLAEMLRSHLDRQQAETTIRHNEERLRLMIEHMPVMVDALDSTGQIRLWNRECERVTGYTAAEIVGNSRALELLYPDPVYRAQMLVEWQTRGNNYRQWAWNITTKDGAVRVIEWSNISDQVPLLNWSTWGIGVDVTDRRRAEEAEQRYAVRMDILHEIDRAILAARSPEETALAALTRIRQLINCHGASIVLFDFQAQVASLLATHHYAQTERHPSQSLTLETYGLATIDALRQGQLLLIEDLSAHPERPIPPQRFMATGMRAWLTTPLFFQGQLMGAFNLGREQPGPFSAEEVEIVQEIAAQLSIAIQQARFFEATERRVRELAGLHDIAQTFNNLTDINETYGTLAERMARLVGAERCYVMLQHPDGWVRAQAPGYGVTNAQLQTLQWPTQRFEEAPIFTDYLEHGFLVRNEVREMTPFFQSLAQSMEMYNGAMTLLKYEKTVIGHMLMINRPGGFSADDARLAGVCAAQAAVVIQNTRLYALEHAARLQTHTLLEVAHTVSSTLSLREVLLSILHEAARVLPFISGSILVYENGVPTLMAFTGHEGREEAIREITFGELQDSPILKSMLAQRQPKLIADVTHHPDWVIYPDTQYIRSWLGVPLIAREEVVGVLALDSDEPQKFSAAEVTVAQALAVQAAIAIQNARLFEQVSTGRAQLQALSQQLVQVQEEERRHLARELHDEVGQMLTGLKLLLGVVPRLAPDTVGQHITEALTVLNQLTERVHDLSLDLRPMMLDDLGLTSALLWLFDRFTSQTGVRVNFESVGLEERLPPEVETTTYRLVQEALTNVARYAEAEEAHIRLRTDGTQLRLQIQDAGKGFDLTTPTSKQRVGLTGMRERTELLGGWLHIESEPGSGTQITAALPLQGRLERRRHDRRDSARR